MTDGDVRIGLGHADLHAHAMVAAIERSSYATQKRGSWSGQSVAVRLDRKSNDRSGSSRSVTQRVEQRRRAPTIAVTSPRATSTSGKRARTRSASSVGDHLNVSDVRTFSWSLKIPYISISGLGGQPGT